MTIGQLKEASCSTVTNAEKFQAYISDSCTKFDISTPIRQLCFLAQVGHESGGLFYTQELASGDAYEGRADLGNTQAGDGPKFKGRGLIQITGRNNYHLAGAALGANFIDEPSLLGGKNINECTPDQLKFAALSAGWFWDLRKLNLVADKIDIKEPIDQGTNLQYYMQITKMINGGYHGLADRLTRYKTGMQYFEVN